ncbi:MAG: hypothetical protein E7429_06275, partial [Ruminococcaceae bacterium]|nr:hypothetical protein [Oscillospiraceae bacterium]
ARMKDRHDVEYCLGPTHEELITSIVRNELRSYKQLPVYLYQTQVKFRDEIRPRFGLMRSREFLMKDGYSFHATQESLQKTYDETSGAYARMCDRMHLKWRAVEADSGQIGGKVTTEFMALAEAGEAEIVHCACGYAADAEAGVVLVFHPDAELPQGVQRHIHVAPGFQRRGHHDLGVAVKKRQGVEQAGDELAGHVAGQTVDAGGEPSTDGQRAACLFIKDALFRKDVEVGLLGALHQPPLSGEDAAAG